jgi:glycosyltransferase involved in cell wall biosynthesis
MRIVIAAPLFPTDIGGAAPYVKKLAGELTKHHDVTVVMYGQLPEKVPGVFFVCISKQQPLLPRLISYTVALTREARKAQVLYAENGPSVELPVGLVSLFVRTPLVVHIGDRTAHSRATRKLLFKLIEHFASNRAHNVVEDIPLEKPEILPFEPFPQKEIEKYERSWEKHVGMLKKIFEYV